MAAPARLPPVPHLSRGAMTPGKLGASYVWPPVTTLLVNFALPYGIFAAVYCSVATARTHVLYAVASLALLFLCTCAFQLWRVGRRAERAAEELRAMAASQRTLAAQREAGAAEAEASERVLLLMEDPAVEEGTLFALGPNGLEIGASALGRRGDDVAATPLERRTAALEADARRTGAVLVKHRVLLTVVALASGWLLGDVTRRRYFKAFDDLDGLTTYVNVDPARSSGQSFMDAGQIYFRDGTVVAYEHAVAFRDGEVYCAAPVVRQPLGAGGGSADGTGGGGAPVKLPVAGSVDFWAVGKNCCQPSGESFHCAGAGRGEHVRAGLRLLRNDDRAFYTLAVDQWASKYGIKAKHPLFLYIVKDPMASAQQLVLWGHYQLRAVCMCAVAAVMAVVPLVGHLLGWTDK